MAINFETVSALTREIKTSLETDERFQYFTIKGEISNFKKHGTGHLYFTLKDSESQVSCIMFKTSTSSLLFVPKEGDRVNIVGKLSVYAPTGSYSIQVFKMGKDGAGKLYEEMELLRKQLFEQGYFKPEFKKVIPKFPRNIGVITSNTGAVIEDIKHTVSRRYKLAQIHLYPALVQGVGAKESIIKQIKHANDLSQVDVLIIGRGGGSIEDLWSFNELEVVMAIFHSSIPVITAIGHETDYTISDDVADLRAPTPTAAAELATPNVDDLYTMIENLEHQNRKNMRYYLSEKEMALANLEHRLSMSNPTYLLGIQKEKLSQLEYNLKKQYQMILTSKEDKLSKYQLQMKSPLELIIRLKEQQKHLEKQLIQRMDAVLAQKQSLFTQKTEVLKALNPLAIMERGFAIIKVDHKIKTSLEEIELNQNIDIELKDGIIHTVVTGKEQKHGKSNI